ncbi:MAG: transglutaminase-like domain-containing protein [Butyrivibrio sp.]|nr:transglutaminase-like domain-containing protein [Butyrivibrio sp.]
MVKPYIDDINRYLESSKIIDYDNDNIRRVADRLYDKSASETDFVRNAYEYVRDKFPHSADAGKDELLCAASEVLTAGHGICFAKSHLLAAILRCKGVPAGLCYQKLILDDETAPYLIYHGLNGVYLSEFDRWIRLDARGNRADVNAQFSVEEEKLAFSVREEYNEIDIETVFSEPDKEIIKVFERCGTRTELWANLPSRLAYTGDL